jgi:hypothetical protein
MMPDSPVDDARAASLSYRPLSSTSWHGAHQLIIKVGLVMLRRWANRSMAPSDRRAETRVLEAATPFLHPSVVVFRVQMRHWFQQVTEKQESLVRSSSTIQYCRPIHHSTSSSSSVIGFSSDGFWVNVCTVIMSKQIVHTPPPYGWIYSLCLQIFIIL